MPKTEKCMAVAMPDAVLLPAIGPTLAYWMAGTSLRSDPACIHILHRQGGSRCSIVWIQVQHCVDPGAALCGFRYSIVWIQVQQCVDPGTAVCGSRCSSVWIQVQQCVDPGTAVCGSRYSSVWIQVQQCVDLPWSQS